MPRRRRWRRDPLAVATEVGRYRRTGQPGEEAADLQRAWLEIAGAEIASQAVVLRRSRAGVVAVACSSAAWAQELDAAREAWRDRLAAAAAHLTVTGMRFVVADHAVPDSGAPPQRPTVRPTPAEVATAEAHTPTLDDVELRKLLVRAQAASLALARERKDLQKARKLGRADRLA